MRIFSGPVTGWRLVILRTKNRLKNWAKRRRASFWCDMLGHKYHIVEFTDYQAWFQDTPSDTFVVGVTYRECRRCLDVKDDKKFPGGLFRTRRIVFGTRVREELK